MTLFPPPSMRSSLSSLGIDDPDLEKLLEARALPLLMGTGTSAGTGPAEGKYALKDPASRLILGRAVGAPDHATILLERGEGPAARTAELVVKAIGPDKLVEVITVGSAASHTPLYVEGDEAPGALIEDWRPGRSVSHVRGTAGTLGVLVEFDKGRGTSRQRVQGFTSAAHVLSLVPDVRPGETVQSPGFPDADLDPATYGVGSLQRWCTLLHRSAEGAEFNGRDVAFVEFSAGELAKLPRKNMVPDPKAPDDSQIAIERVAAPDEVSSLPRDTAVFMIGRSSGFRAGVLHSAAGPTTINLRDRRSYVYTNLYFVRPADVGLGFSVDGDSGGPVYLADGALIGFVVGQAAGGSWVQLAAPCLAFAKARLLV